MVTMRSLDIIFAVLFVRSVECAKIQVTESNFFSIYFSTLWEAIKAKLQEVKTYLETEIPKLLQKLELEIPKFVQTVETEVPKFVENLHLKEEFEEKTEAIVNATGKVKRYLGDLWETEFTSTVSNLRDVFLIILVLTVIALCAYLYLECFLFRKLFQLLSVIPRILFKGLRTVFRRVSKMRLKENYVHVYKDGKVYVNIV